MTAKGIGKVPMTWQMVLQTNFLREFTPTFTGRKVIYGMLIIGTAEQENPDRIAAWSKNGRYW
jgi:hypothetical protein